MGDENPDDIAFEFIKFKPEGEEKTKSSREYTGRGLAKYANNEIYDGEYNEGVTVILILFRDVMEKVNILMQMVINMKVILKIMLSMEQEN